LNCDVPVGGEPLEQDLVSRDAEDDDDNFDTGD
jgi:hypothetical protein